MAAPSRYEVSDRGAGIENGILKNKFGITDQGELNRAETLLLSDAYAYFFERLSLGRLVFDIETLFSMHGYFLGALYGWAWKPRTVDISKDGMMFAPVRYLSSSIESFAVILESGLPVADEPRRRIARKIAVTHNEFNALHPFREGNGRTIRLFLDLLVASLVLPPVDWNVKGYMRACVRGMSGDHAPMAGIVYRSIAKGT